MKKNQLAAILIACAVALALGAYLLVVNQPKDASVVRSEVQPVENATAPTWVNQGQNAEPDYSTVNAEAHNATPPPTPEPIAETAPTQPGKITEDRVVTFTFVESLADFMLHRFQPQDEKGKPATLASAKALNMYYGRELDGFAASGDDIRAMRKSVLDYAFTPAMIKNLHALYAEIFVDHLAETATADERDYLVNGKTERRVLDDEEVKVMLRLNARRIEQTATVFKAVSQDHSITEMAAKYLRSAKAVERANLQLQTAISDEKGISDASDRLKQAIIQREQVKSDLVTRLKQACHACDANDLFYLAQWSYRRILGSSEDKLDAFAAVSEVLDDLAGRFKAKADAIN